MNAADSLIVVGYAKVPTASAAHGTHDLFSISMRVDRHTGVVTEVDCTAATTVARNWLGDLLLGANLNADPAPLQAIVEDNYLGQGGGAVRQAIADAWRRYARLRADR